MSRYGPIGLVAGRPFFLKGRHVPTPLDVALDYIARGWAPAPIPYCKKRPCLESWQSLRIAAETAVNYFSDSKMNIGVLLGEASGGLVDVDLDCYEAIAAAPYILPPTLGFGRASKRNSHWLYYGLSGVATRLQFKDDKELLFEIRIGPGLQTVFPGSAHPSGEEIKWENPRDPVATVASQELLLKAQRLETVVKLARRWPKQEPVQFGARHIAAYFGEAGVSIPEAKLYVAAVARAAALPLDDVKQAVSIAAERLLTARRLIDKPAAA
jgi:hypothetical protein